MPLVSEYSKTKRGETRQLLNMIFHDKTESVEITLEKERGAWFLNALDKLTIGAEKQMTFSQLKDDFEMYFEDFELFWFSKPIQLVRNHGLLVL